MGRAPRGIGRREHHRSRHHFAVGAGPSAPAPAAAPAPAPAATSIPAGMAPVFFGWNVWDVYQASDPDEGILGKIWHAGISQDQLIKLWVENQVEDNASGANVSDPINPDPEHTRGDEVQLLTTKPSGLAVAVGRESAGLGGALQLGKVDSPALLRSVRFYNRGKATVMPWPHDQNFVVDAVYSPDAASPLTNSPAPSTAGGTVAAAGDAAAKALSSVLTTVAIVGVVLVGAVVAISFANAKKVSAAA
jgi:hypothetical protein